VLDEFQGEFEGKEAPAKLDCFVSPDDSLILEDESGRAALSFSDQGADLIARLVTGVVVAVVGTLTDAGAINVSRIVFPGVAPMAAPFKPLAPPAKLIVASNLRVGKSKGNVLAANALLDWIADRGAICRVVLCGGTVATAPAPADRSAKAQEQAVEPIHAADAFIAELASLVRVDMMAGPGDPCNESLPQQAVLPFLFARASRLSTFQSVCNPYLFSLGGVRALAHSGQAVADVLLYSQGLEPLDVMRQSLLAWRHLAPTAPDTLSCYPFNDRDPFVVEETPHVYFCSSLQGGFATQFEQGVRLVAVPDFARTGDVVEIDLASPTLEARVVSFRVDMEGV